MIFYNSYMNLLKEINNKKVVINNCSNNWCCNNICNNSAYIILLINKLEIFTVIFRLKSDCRIIKS